MTKFNVEETERILKTLSRDLKHVQWHGDLRTASFVFKTNQASVLDEMNKVATKFEGTSYGMVTPDSNSIFILSVNNESS